MDRTHLPHLPPLLGAEDHVQRVGTATEIWGLFITAVRVCCSGSAVEVIAEGSAMGANALDSRIRATSKVKSNLSFQNRKFGLAGHG